MVDLYFRKIGLTGDTSGIQVDFFVNLLLKEDHALPVQSPRSRAVRNRTSNLIDAKLPL